MRILCINKKYLIKEEFKYKITEYDIKVKIIKLNYFFKNEF